MPSFVKKSLFICLFFFINSTAFAQRPYSFRVLLSRVHITASMGYGGAKYSYRALNGKQKDPSSMIGKMIVFKRKDQFYLYAGDSKEVYLIRWFDGSDIQMPVEEDLDLEDLDKIEGIIDFKGQGTTMPISLNAHVDLWSKMRVGFGGALLINRLKKLEHKLKEPAHKLDEDSEPDEKPVSLGSYIPSKKTHYCLRPFIYLGYKFIENSTLSVLLDTTLGYEYMYSIIDRKLTDFFDLGAKSLGFTIEGNISEYFRLFSRISYERSDLSRSFSQEKVGLASERQSVLLQFGLSLNFPEVPRCQLAACRIERKHKHGGKVYRGVSIFTSRDAQGRRMYKK